MEAYVKGNNPWRAKWFGLSDEAPGNNESGPLAQNFSYRETCQELYALAKQYNTTYYLGKIGNAYYKLTSHHLYDFDGDILEEIGPDWTSVERVNMGASQRYNKYREKIVSVNERALIDVHQKGYQKPWKRKKNK